MKRIHADDAGGADRADHGIDERAQLLAAALSATLADDRGQSVRGDDASRDSVFEIVTDVRDAVGPAHDLALWGARCRA